MNVSVKPQKAVHPTTALFFDGRNAMQDENYDQAIECFERLMGMLRAEPEKYARDIVLCDSYLEQCQKEKYDD